MTNPIGSGTANLSINVPIDERRFWGRLAFQAIERGEAKSVGDFQRQIIARGLEAQDPEAAAKLREIRTRYYGGITLAALLLVSGLSSWFDRDHQAARRTSSARGIRLSVRGNRQELEVVTL